MTKAKVTVLLSIWTISSTFSQSSSVLDASYFISDNYIAPLKPGKGFHINDPFQQTNFCFTSESADKSKLVQQQTGSKSSYKVYFTQTDQEFNELKSTGVSGKVSYLNLFSLGASNLQEFTSRTATQIRRLIFVANVDYGNFEYDKELVLTSDAKSYISSGKYNDFVSMYGTHYITGVKKEASIWIIISESSKNITFSNSNMSQIDFGASIPSYGIGGSVSFTDTYQANEFLNSSDLSVSIDINGPTSLNDQLLNSIKEYLKSGEGDKYSKIVDLISSTQKSLTDPSQSVVTQYYFAPFTLKGVQNINWDIKKENQLAEINQNVLRVLSAKNVVDNLVSNGVNSVLNIYDSFFSGSEFNGKATYRNDLSSAYYQILPDLKQQQSDLNTIYSNLESSYRDCSNITCSNTTACCDFTSNKNTVNLLIPKVESTVAKINDIFKTVKVIKQEQESLPPCQKNNTGILTIVNSSSNPYNIYINGNFVYTINGKGADQIEVNIGTVNVKAEQKSGYMFYPTVNNRVTNFNRACAEVTINVGFED